METLFHLTLVGRKMLVMFLLCLLLSGFSVIVEAGESKDLKDAILETQVYTNAELNFMDSNKDGKVDVADLIFTSGDITPTVNFVSASSVATEGDGKALITVKFTDAFSGELAYRLSALDQSNENAPLKYVSFSGYEAVISIDIEEDSELENSEIIQISLEENGQQYVLGESLSHTLIINDNDGLWAGTVNIDGFSSPIAMRIIQTKTGVNVDLVSDGEGLIPINIETQDVNGDSYWVAKSVTLATESLSAVFENIRTPASQLQIAKDLRRSYIFSETALPIDRGESELPIISGDITEQLYWDEAPHLNRSAQGVYTLMKQTTPIDIPAS